jgi:ketosteroid isomerase-like protein
VSEAPVDVVRRQFAATNERDFERAMDIYADDVVLVVHPGWGLGSGTYEGKTAVGEWFGDWFRQFSPDYHFDITQARDLGGGGVLVAARHGGAGRVSGVAVGGETGYLYRVAGDKIVQVALFSTPADAEKATSLPGWSEAKTD